MKQGVGEVSSVLHQGAAAQEEKPLTNTQ